MEGSGNGCMSTPPGTWTLEDGFLGTLGIASIKTYTFSISKFVGFWFKRLKTFNKSIV